MKIIDAFFNFLRSILATKPRLVSARTTDAAPRAPVSLRHRASMVHGRFFTRDAATPTRDAWLSAESKKNYEPIEASNWTGGARPEMSGLRVDPATLGPERMFDDLDLSTTTTAADINEASRRFWTSGNSEPTTDTAACTVDRAAAARHARAATNATSIRDQADHMNAAARDFWGSAAR